MKRLLIPIPVSGASLNARTAHRRVGFFPLFSWGLALVLLLALTSCGTKKNLSNTDFQSLARAGLVLGFDIDWEDDHALMLEAARWVGTPYRAGGNDRSGIDCSGLSSQIYKNVYRVRLSRRSEDQYRKDCRTHKRRKHLKSGDLVFFHPTGKRKVVNHVGIYLKDNKFIHASSSKGVRVDDLDDGYWRRHWLGGGSVAH